MVEEIKKGASKLQKVTTNQVVKDVLQTSGYLIAGSIFTGTGTGLIRVASDTIVSSETNVKEKLAGLAVGAVGFTNAVVGTSFYVTGLKKAGDIINDIGEAFKADPVDEDGNIDVDILSEEVVDE